MPIEVWLDFNSNTTVACAWSPKPESSQRGQRVVLRPLLLYFIISVFIRLRQL